MRTVLLFRQGFSYYNEEHVMNRSGRSGLPEIFFQAVIIAQGVVLVSIIDALSIRSFA